VPAKALFFSSPDVTAEPAPADAQLSPVPGAVGIVGSAPEAGAVAVAALAPAAAGSEPATAARELALRPLRPADALTAATGCLAGGRVPVESIV
jgi:hypothetical protein